MNRQILTRRTGLGRRLETTLVERPLRRLNSGEILVEILFVPMHGSFWLASHPDGLHPRFDEFLADGEFVFGNGGVGQVVQTAPDCRRLQPGDFVSVMGHLPCKRDDCRACNVLHRYTECDFGESVIVGHGKGAPDGTYADFSIMGEIACERCFHAKAQPSPAKLLPFMFAFLLADVRNALTRDADSLRRQRILLIGAGYSGHLAAWLVLHACPEARIVAVDTQPDMLASIVRMAPGSISAVELPALRRAQTPERIRDLAISRVSRAVDMHFNGRKCNLIFDASSGNTTWLWANAQLLSAGCHCIPYGFGSEQLLLDKTSLQVSGLKIMTSRGVGNLDNRRQAMELIHRGATQSIVDLLSMPGSLLQGLGEAVEFIRRQHNLPDSAHQVPRVYITPRGCQ